MNRRAFLKLAGAITAGVVLAQTLGIETIQRVQAIGIKMCKVAHIFGVTHTVEPDLYDIIPWRDTPILTFNFRDGLSGDITIPETAWYWVGLDTTWQSENRHPGDGDFVTEIYSQMLGEPIVQAVDQAEGWSQMQSCGTLIELQAGDVLQGRVTLWDIDYGSYIHDDGECPQMWIRQV